MSVHAKPDWAAILKRADLFSEPAVQFVRDGLGHTVGAIHAESEGVDGAKRVRNMEDGAPPTRHVSGQQLCMGIRDLAIERYGLLAQAVLRRWGFRRTEDFGVVVYALIARGEMRGSDEDRYEDFRDVYEFDEAFGPETLAGLS